MVDLVFPVFWRASGSPCCNPQVKQHERNGAHYPSLPDAPRKCCYSHESRKRGGGERLGFKWQNGHAERHGGSGEPNQDYAHQPQLRLGETNRVRASSVRREVVTARPQRLAAADPAEYCVGRCSSGRPLCFYQRNMGCGPRSGLWEGRSSFGGGPSNVRSGQSDNRIG
jgi:hypothetical protein